MRMLLDEEVFAVVLAVSVVASAVGIALVLGPGGSEAFTAIGLLNSECRIGEYPVKAYNGSTLHLCLFIYNHMGEAIYYRVAYKIAASQGDMPTNTTPSPRPVIAEWKGVLGDGWNETTRVEVPVAAPSGSSRVALVFELWVYRQGEGWVYTGRWVHLYVNVTSW